MRGRLKSRPAARKNGSAEDTHSLCAPCFMKVDTGRSCKKRGAEAFVC
jgi:hypothetical protein